MCFSAEASFVGGVVISTIGVITVRKVHRPSQLIFASIPLFFGLQQFTEGFLWLSLPLPEYTHIHTFTTYMFLLMAQVFWPLVIPLSVFFMEENDKKKKVLVSFLILGFALSFYYAYCLINYTVVPQITNYHIQYNNDFPKALSMYAFAIYLIVTITPLFISSIKRTHLLGALMLSSCVISAIFFTQYLTSVWCFFAALISGVIFLIIRDSKRAYNSTKLIQ